VDVQRSFGGMALKPQRLLKRAAWSKIVYFTTPPVFGTLWVTAGISPRYMT